jgi:prevent-host-death family protein
MPREVSLYDAKAKLSALVRQVREGRSVIITVHGERVAELVPYRPPEEPRSIDARIAELEAQGLIQPADRARGEAVEMPLLAKRPGTLARFLADRD